MLERTSKFELQLQLIAFIKFIKLVKFVLNTTCINALHN